MINYIKNKAKELGFNPKNDINFILKFRKFLIKKYNIRIIAIYSYKIDKYSIIISYDSNNFIQIGGFYDSKELAFIKGVYEACLYLNTKNVA